jgi:translation initiation factor eIF-2B subunit alpha
MMKDKDKAILNRLMREHEAVFGASRVTMIALRAFMAALDELNCPRDQLRHQCLELTQAIKQTQPKVIPLIHLIEEFEAEMEPLFGGDTAAVKAGAIEILQAKHDKLQAKSGKIIELGLTVIDQGDTIAVHTVNINVINIITLAHQVMDKQLNVILLQQDQAHTKRIISRLRMASVSYQAVPEYALNHFIGKADKMFFGALSITADGQVVAPIGTANITSLCHFHHIPVYLFANTLKFSHGHAQDQHIHQETITQAKDAEAYELTTYSHDVMDLNLVDFLVSEDGIFPKDQINGYMDGLPKGQPAH